MWGNGNATFDVSGKLFGVTNLSIVKPNAVPKGSFVILRYFDTEDQCNSFIRYMYTKLSAFLIYIGICGTTLNRDFWRFIPDPQDWSVIYEDRALPDYTPDENGIYEDKDKKKHCSLYDKYGLSDDDIEIIESVIKERK